MRTVGSCGDRTGNAIREAGLRLIVKHGYEGMTLRQLAASVGMQVGSLYPYIANKQQLLYSLVLEHMELLLVRLDEEMEGMDDPVKSLERFCEFHINYHMRRRSEVIVINSELRSLDDRNRAHIVLLRSRYEQYLKEIIRRGQELRQFRELDPTVAAFGIIAMMTGICTWYRENGRLSDAEISKIYSQMVMGGLSPN